MTFVFMYLMPTGEFVTLGGKPHLHNVLLCASFNLCLCISSIHLSGF